jgi:oligosaccharide repeat unit polymerase
MTIPYIDILSFLTIVLLSKFVFKSLRNPIFLICAWWSGFLLLSNIVVIGTGITMGTHLVFLLFIYSILVSGIVSQLSIRPAGFPMPKFVIRYKTVWIVVCIAIYLLSIWLGFSGYTLQKEYEADYRTLAFSTGDYSSLLYQSYYLQLAANFVLSPFLLVGVIAFPVASIFYNNYKFLLLGLVFSVVIDLQGFGRLYSYYFLLATGLAVIFVKKVTLFSNFKLLPIGLAVFIMASWITGQRASADKFNSEVVEKTIDQVLIYHVMGAYLFDFEFSNNASILYKGTSLGRLSLFSYPDRIACMVLRRLGFDAIATADELAEHWQRGVWLGDGQDGHPIEANAFYTTLYPIFYDFGYFGVVLVPAFFAYYIVLHFKTFRKHNNVLSLLVVVFLVIFFMTSIFTSKITSNEFLPLLYGILLLYSGGRELRQGGNGTVSNG